MQGYARLNLVDSVKGTALERSRHKLVDEEVVVERDGALYFGRNQVFGSPSMAAAVVTARTANGWVTWLGPDGRTLDRSRDGRWRRLAMVEGRRFGLEPATANARAGRFGIWRATVAGCVAAVLLAGCAAPLSPRLADPIAPSDRVSITRLATITSGPRSLRHRHTAVLRVIAFDRDVPAPFDLAAIARATIDSTLAQRAQHIAVTHLPPDDADALALLSSDCLIRRSGRLSATCKEAFATLRGNHRADAVIIVADWVERDLINALAGAGVFSRRNEANQINAIAYLYMGAHVIVADQPASFVAAPCQDDGSGLHALDSSIDPDVLDLGQLDWLEPDFRRRIAAVVDRALARSGVIDMNPAACANPASEGTRFAPPPL